MNESLDVFAVAAPGLETVCAAELAAAGIAPQAQPVDGGVAWCGDARSVYRANLESRTASRVVVRAGSFRARTFAELERRAAKLSWQQLLRPGAAVALRITCRKSKLYHEGAVAERLTRTLDEAIGARVQLQSGEDEVAPAAGGDGVAADDAAQLIIVRFLRDVCTISIDASGRLLHQRGYRQALAKAPVRETIAAAMLLASDWRGDAPLLDPMCGAGTIPVEAALLARHIAPGLATGALAPRRYAFEQWPGFDAAVWADVVDTARARVRALRGVAILGYDRDGGAVAAARANAERAGVAGDVSFAQQPLSALAEQPLAAPAEQPLAAPAVGASAGARGHLVTNPPYGVRIGERRALAPLYAALGRVARERLGGWTVVMLSAEPALAAATTLPLRELLATRNGGIAVRLLTADVPASP